MFHVLTFFTKVETDVSFYEESEFRKIEFSEDLYRLFFSTPVADNLGNYFCQFLHQFLEGCLNWAFSHLKHSQLVKNNKNYFCY